MTPMTGSEDAGTSVAFTSIRTFLTLLKSDVRKIDAIWRNLLRQQHMKNLVEAAFIVNRISRSIDEGGIHIYECGNCVFVDDFAHDH